MRFTALVTILMGVAIGGLSGLFYASLGGADRSEVPLLFGGMGVAVVLTIAGAAMWFIGGRRPAHAVVG